MPADMQALNALRAILKAIQVKEGTLSGFRTEYVVGLVKSTLGIDDHAHINVLEELKHDNELSQLTGQPPLKKQRVESSSAARPKSSKPRPLTIEAAMPPPPPRAAPRPRSKGPARPKVEAMIADSPIFGSTTPRSASSRRAGPPVTPQTAPPALQAGPAANPMLQVGLDLIGRRMLRYWPEKGGWHEAVVSDFDATKNQWTLVYNLGHGTQESWEEFDILKAAPDELIMLDDERVDINTYKAPLREVYTGVPPPKAFSDRDFATRLDYNSRIPRGLEAVRIELDQRECAIKAETDTLELLDKYEDQGLSGPAVTSALQDQHLRLCEAEKRIREELDKLVDV